MPEDHEPTDEELEERLKHLLGADGEPLEHPDPIEAKLAEIEERSKRIREGNPFPEPPEWNYKRPPNAIPKYDGGDYYRGAGIGLAILYAFVGPILAGVGIGWLIDRRTHGSAGMLWGTMIGVVCGFIAGIVMVSRAGASGPKE